MESITRFDLSMSVTGILCQLSTVLALFKAGERFDTFG
jgi:hypothetical protein